MLKPQDVSVWEMRVKDALGMDDDSSEYGRN